MLACMRDKRDHAILALLQAEQAASVCELAEATGASPATIRRDLQRLDRAGLLRRTYGGATLLEGAEGDAPFLTVEARNREEKTRIAEAAAETIRDGHTIVLDIGTTTLQLARLLRGRRLTVITSNLAAVDVLQDDEKVHVVVLAGDYDPTYRSVSGHLTTETLRLLRADHAFLGVSGVSADGDLRDTTIAQIPIKQAMAAACDAVTVMADSSKFPGTGTGRVILPDVPTRVITNTAPPPGVSAAFARKKMEVMVV